MATRNQRLAAIHALARFVGERRPEHLAGCGQVRSIPFKKASQTWIPSLDKPEMDALLGAPDRPTLQGRRDHALLLFLYNSGARAPAAAQMLISELDLAGCSVKIRGKGGKERQCPLWPGTVEEVKPLLVKRSPASNVFLNRCGHPITRFGIYAVIERYVRRIQTQMPSLVSSGSVRTPYAIQRPRTSSAPASTSTPSVPGSGMSPLTRPTFTPKSIWK
jgi:site-specific recombinase XerD